MRINLDKIKQDAVRKLKFHAPDIILAAAVATPFVIIAVRYVKAVKSMDVEEMIDSGDRMLLLKQSDIEQMIATGREMAFPDGEGKYILITKIRTLVA